MSIESTPAQSITTDCNGVTVAPGDRVRILGVTPDPDMDEDELDLFLEMVGATCDVERIDGDGLAWVAVWWNTVDGSLTTSVGLEPGQMCRET